MCRNIKTLFNFEPPATEEEIRAASIQFARKLSGFTHPSKANEPAFDRAVDKFAEAAHELLESLVTNAEPRDREIEAQRAQSACRRTVRPQLIGTATDFSVTRRIRLHVRRILAMKRRADQPSGREGGRHKLGARLCRGNLASR